MIEQNYGRIVNVGADSVRNGLWQHAAYNAAKGGMHGLTTGLAREFAGLRHHGQHRGAVHGEHRDGPGRDRRRQSDRQTASPT